MASPYRSAPLVEDVTSREGRCPWCRGPVAFAEVAVTADCPACGARYATSAALVVREPEMPLVESPLALGPFGRAMVAVGRVLWLVANTIAWAIGRVLAVLLAIVLLVLLGWGYRFKPEAKQRELRGKAREP
jgi:hypothetical protein